MSGASRQPSRTAGSIFLAAACASALSSTLASAASICTNTGTEA